MGRELITIARLTKAFFRLRGFGLLTCSLILLVSFGIGIPAQAQVTRNPMFRVTEIEHGASTPEALSRGLTRLYIQDRTVKWSLYQSLLQKKAVAESLVSEGRGAILSTENQSQLDGLLDFIDSYLKKPALILQPKTTEEFTKMAANLLESPLLFEDEIERVFIRKDLPPRYELELSQLDANDLAEVSAALQSYDFHLAVRPLAKFWLTRKLANLWQIKIDAVFDTLSNPGAEGIKRRKQLRGRRIAEKLELEAGLARTIDQQLEEALEKANDLISKINIRDRDLSRFIQVFMKGYLRGLPQHATLEIVSHLLQYGYPFSKLSAPELIGLLLARSGPTAQKIVQTFVDKMPEEYAEVLRAFQDDAPGVPLYFMKDLLRKVIPRGAKLFVRSERAGTGSIAQVYESEMLANAHLDPNEDPLVIVDGPLEHHAGGVRVAARLIKRGVRKLFADESVAIETAIHDVETYPELAGTPYANIRLIADDLSTMIKDETDATNTARKQISATENYSASYESKTGWTYDFAVPNVVDQATQDGGLQEWSDGSSFKTFTKAHPDMAIDAKGMLLTHFIMKGISGYVHGDLHAGNIKIKVDRANKKISVSILDTGMFETVPLTVRQGLIRLFLGMQLNRAEFVQQGLEKIQDLSRSHLNQEQIKEIVDAILSVPSGDARQRLIALSRETLARGFSSHISAAALIRSLTAMKTKDSIEIEHSDLVNRILKDAFSNPKHLKELAQMSGLSFSDIGFVGTKVAEVLREKRRASVAAAGETASRVASGASSKIGGAFNSLTQSLRNKLGTKDSKEGTKLEPRPVSEPSSVPSSQGELCAEALRSQSPH